MCTWWKSKKWQVLVTQFLAAMLFLFPLATVPVQAAPIAAPVIGEIERLTLNNAADIYSGGRIVVGGQSVILPKNLLIDLPANRLTLQQIFAKAPAGCVANGESGLAKVDTCNASGAGGFATISAVRTNSGDVIAGDVLIEKGKEAVTGQVTYINYTDGYFRVNGVTGDSATGVMLRLNDPTSRHTIQQGLGCAGGPNCSPDPRFTLDPDNYVVAFSTGYPVCIPSMVTRTTPTGLPAGAGIPAILAGSISQASADGTGDLFCPSTNRTPGAAVEPPVADSRRFAPLMVGDSVTAKGNFETILGVRFVSVHTMRVNKALETRNAPDQPDYFFLEEVFIEAPGFQNQRARALFIGFTTLAPTDVDIWSIHRDPITNSVHEFPLASVKGCDLGVGKVGSCSNQGLVGAGANIFSIRYDVDFLLAKASNPASGAKPILDPCTHLRGNPRWASRNLCTGGGTSFANNFGVMSPVPHEIQARSGHLLDNLALADKTIDVRGNQATNGQYLFPLGINLGGIELADFLEVDVNMLTTPVLFEGIPWNLDRRLSPSGCLDNAGVPAACPGGGPIPLDPFPFTGLAVNPPGQVGLDPGLQAEFAVTPPGGVTQFGGTPKGVFADLNFTKTSLTPAYNRVRSYVTDVGAGVFNFNGLNTLLPFPVDPPAQGIVSTPTFTLAVSSVGFAGSARAQNDMAVTRMGVPVSIPVLSNDAALVGLINFSSITIVSPASHGTAIANPDGTVKYTPGPGYSGGDSFTYTFSELTSGEVSNIATVTVVVNRLATGSFTPGAPASIDDALKAIRIAVGLATPTAEDLLNGDVAPLGAPDGQINTADALLILKKAVGLLNF
jgi:Big-like domain-containing protein